MTVGEQFMDRVAAGGDREAYRFPDGDDWASISWKEVGAKVTRLAAGLVSLGIEPQQRIGIASGTRVEWIYADLAIMCAGAATTTVYPSTMTDDVAYILSDSECRIVFAEDDAQIAKLREKKSELPHVSKVVTFEGTADGDWVIGLADLEKLGEELLNENGSAVQERIDGTDGDSLATLIYTSGTTGRPKGVRLRHQSWTYEGAAIQAQDILSEDDLQYLWLPMAHSFGKVLLSTQLAIGFATAVDGRVEKIIENLAVVKPTFMGAAPRIFEKAHGRIMTMQAQEGGLKEKIFNAAFAVGKQVETAQGRRQERPAAPQGAARPLRQAGLQQDPRALRRTRPVLHLRRGRAEPRGGGVVPRRRHPHPRGLRHDRDLGRLGGQPPRTPTSSARSASRCPAPRSRSPRTARSASRARASWRATTTCPRRPTRRWSTGGSTPATSASSTAST